MKFPTTRQEVTTILTIGGQKGGLFVIRNLGEGGNEAKIRWDSKEHSCA